MSTIRHSALLISLLSVTACSALGGAADTTVPPTLPLEPIAAKVASCETVFPKAYALSETQASIDLVSFEVRGDGDAPLGDNIWVAQILLEAIEEPTDEDVSQLLDDFNACLARVLQDLPPAVLLKIENTRAIDGTQTDSVDGVEYTWTYGPPGLTVIIEPAD